MYEKFLELKKTKPWLFWLLIIPFIVVAGLELYNKYLVGSSKKIVDDAEEKDQELKKEQDKAEAGAEYHKEESEKIGEEIESINVDENWHLKE